MNATSPSTKISRDVTIINRKGLHARAAAKVVKLCSQFQCDVNFSRNDMTSPGRSILDLLMLAAAQGKSVTILCDGSDAQIAIDEISALIGRGFDEEDYAEDNADSVSTDALQHGCCSD